MIQSLFDDDDLETSLVVIEYKPKYCGLSKCFTVLQYSLHIKKISPRIPELSVQLISRRSGLLKLKAHSYMTVTSILLIKGLKRYFISELCHS